METEQVRKGVWYVEKEAKELEDVESGGLSMAQLECRMRLLREIADLMSIEEIYWKQRSWVLWLVEGDRNLMFFHQRASGRKRKNTIRKLKDEEDTEHVGDEAVRRVAISYFHNIFASLHPSMISKALHSFGSRITDDMDATLRADYREDEVKLVLSQMHRSRP